MECDRPGQWLDRQFGILHALDQQLAAAHSATEVAQVGLDHLRQLISWERASVLLLDEEAGEAFFLDSGPHGAADLGGSRRLPLDDFRELTSFRRGHTRVVTDVEALDDAGPVDRRLQALGLRAYVNVPLLVRDQFLGLMNVGRAAPGLFPPAELTLMRAVAGRIALSLWQERLYAQLQRQARRLEAEVAQRTATLSRQRDFLDAVFDTAGALIIILDDEGRVVRLNAQAAQLTGLTRAQAYGRPIWELLPLEIDFTPPLLQEMRAGRFPHHFESRLHSPSGARRLVDWSNAALADEQGRVRHIIAVGIDTTGRRRAEQAYQHLVENSLQGLVILQERRVVFVNPAFTTLTGYRPDALYEMTPADLLAIIHPEQRATFAERLESRFRRETLPPRFEFRFRRADGAWRWLESYTRLVDYGGQPAVQAACLDITERKQVQEATRRLAAIVSSSDDAIIGKTLAGKITSWNQGATRIYGYREEEVLGRHIAFLAPPERQAEIDTLSQRLARGERVEQYETVRLRRDGKQIDVSLTLSPIHDERGEIAGVATIARDVTARKRVEAALRASETFNQAVLDSLPVHVAVLDAEGQIRAVNRAWQQFAEQAQGEYRACTGVETHDLQICRCAVGKEKAAAHRVLDGVKGVVEGRSPRFSHEYACYLDAGPRWFLMNVTPLGAGKEGAVVSHIDITERRQAERQIRYQASLIENIQDAIISTDSAWRIQSWNEAAERLYGWPAAEALGRPVQEIVQTQYAPGERQQVIAQVLEAGHWEGQVVQKHRAGDELYIYASVSVLVDLAGKPAGAVAVNRDVGERVRAQQERERLFRAVNRQRRQLRTLTRQLRRLTRQVVTSQEEERHRLSRELHDEAGQALSVLRYSLELFRRDLLSSPEGTLSRREADHRLAEALGLCDQTLQQVRRMAHDLRPGSLDDLGLNMALEAYCHDFGERTRLPIDYQGLEVPPLPHATAISLYRFLQEALTNVLKHAQARHVRVRLRQEGDRLLLTVADDGRGFPPKGNGRHRTGIGLLGMKERLEALHGELMIESQPGTGTCLLARIPCEQPLSSEESAHEPDPLAIG